jgi:hypothetical protein
MQEIERYIYADWLTISRSSFLSIYWIGVLVACIFLFPILWKEKLGYVKIISTFLVFFFTYRMLVITLPYTSWELNIDFLLTKQKILFRSEIWQRYLYMSVFYVHIFTSPLVLIAGASQFSRTLMFERAVWHRNIGKMYVAVILFLSAPAGLVMSFYANGNLVSKFSFSFLTILWWKLTYLAYRKALQKQWIAHANLMLRSYALTFSAITLRLYMFLIATFDLLDTWTATEIYVMLSFMSWIPNLAVAEFLIHQGISKKLMQKRQNYTFS